jgi:tyrosine-protein phosphatase SIW14
MRGLKIPSLILLCAAWTLRAEAAQDAPASRPVPNFHEVARDFYRGGQPRKGGFAYLKKLGVKTVINLRGENKEKEEIQALGMKYVQIPMRAWESIPDANIQKFFDVLKDRGNYPVFVHCERGADRTGFMVGLYRIAFEGWSAEKAYQEARAYGMHWWYINLKRRMYQFASQPVSARPTAAPP